MRDRVEPPALLGVESSVLGRRWCQRGGESAALERTARTISQTLGVADVVGRVLAARGVDPDQAADFLSPTLKALLPDPAHLRGMAEAVARLVQAVETGETIAVFGDYDVDGATSSALMLRFLRALGLSPLFHIPDRQKEGYGPNADALLALKAQGAGLVVTVDCGMTAFAPLEAAQQAGVDVIVIDHHEPAAEGLPPAVAVVNPKRLDDPSPHTHLAAVGVAFLVVVAVNRALRESGWYGRTATPEPRLLDWLDLVALGTVCDVVPLWGVNRALVAQGLKVLAQRGTVGLAALAEVAGVRDAVSAYHLGYVFGPRINAGGRVGEADMGTRLLVCDDPAEAARLAESLNGYNQNRQEIEAAILYEAVEQAETTARPDSPLILVQGQDWHPGVVGIIASRLKERYDRPACVVALDGGLAKGSGRSVPGLDLGRAILEAREAHLLETGGGHAMAAGFTLRPERLEAFQAFLEERLRAQLAGESLTPTLEVDGVVHLHAATPDLLETLSKVEPFGAGNEEPRFVVPDVRVARSDVVGQGHVRCFLTTPTGGRLKAIAFKSADSDLGLLLLNSAGRALHLAGCLRLDSWQGRAECQLVIDDAAVVESLLG